MLEVEGFFWLSFANSAASKCSVCQMVEAAHLSIAEIRFYQLMSSGDTYYRTIMIYMYRLFVYENFTGLKKIRESIII